MSTRHTAVLLGAIVAVLTAAELPAQDPARPRIRTTTVAEGLSVLTGGGANIGVSVGADGVLLVDDGVVPATEGVRAAIAALDPRQPRIVLNTNWHYDHADGNEAFAALGATVIAHPRSRPHMLAEQRITELEPALVVAPYRRGALPVVTVDEPATVHFNGDEISVIHVPGAHSDGDLAFVFRRANVIFTGDLFFPAGDLFIHFTGGGTTAGMIRAADRILALADDETRIVPGHGPVCRRTDVTAARTFLVAIRDRIVALMERGQTVEQVVAADPLQDLFTGRPSVSPARWARLVYEDLARARAR